jgi:hypothetical protein
MRTVRLINDVGLILMVTTKKDMNMSMSDAVWQKQIRKNKQFVDKESKKKIIKRSERKKGGKDSGGIKGNY